MNDVSMQLSVWGWAVTSGGVYPTARDRWNAEREVAILEGCVLDGQFDLGAVDLLSVRRFHGDVEVPVPASWALVGHADWVIAREWA